MAIPVAGAIASAGYCASQILRKQQEEADDAYWDSLSKEEKEKIYQADLAYYHWKAEQEIKEAKQKYYAKLLHIEKRKAIIAKIKEFVDDYFFNLFYKIFHLKIDYLICILHEFYKDLYLYEPMEKINLKDLKTIGKILKNRHNCNFTKCKKLILFKFQNVEDRKQYLEKVYDSVDLFNDEDKFILSRILQIKK